MGWIRSACSAMHIKENEQSNRLARIRNVLELTCPAFNGSFAVIVAEYLESVLHAHMPADGTNMHLFKGSRSSSQS
jgi:hypothetical protein